MTALNAWYQLRDRCNNPNFRQWKDYGGRGIRVRFASFDEFLAEVGERPPGLTIDRIDNDGDYAPGNVRWATREEQQRNRRNPATVEIRGKTYRVMDLIAKYGGRHDVIKARAEKGLSFAKVISPERTRDLSGLVLGGMAFAAKMKQRTHCSKGHKYTAKNTRITPDGWRNCRECHRLKMLSYTAKNR